MHSTVFLSGIRRAAAVAAVVVGLVAAAPAYAQMTDSQAFKPAPFGNSMVSVFGGETIPAYVLDLGAMLHYQNKPIENGVLDHQLTLDLLLSVGVTEWFDMGMGIPVILFQDGAGDPDKFGIGDVRVVPRMRIVKLADGTFALAIVPMLTVPIGREFDPLMGDIGLTFVPTLALSSRIDWFRFGLDLFYRLTENYDEIGAKLGLEFTVARQWQIIGEVFGSTFVKEAFDSKKNSPMEGLLAARWWPQENISVTAGGAVGITDGYNTPVFRVFGGVMYAWAPVYDADEDGIEDKLDACPEDAEDRDGFEDTDGCPDNDNDRDGISDFADKCPNEAEDRDGWNDSDGCPETDDPKDADKDGILDEKDACPDQAEDKDGFEDADGCPDPDNDKDGIADAMDRCPLEKETVNGHQDDDGCPDQAPVEYKNIVITENKIELKQKVFFKTGSSTIEQKSFGMLDEIVDALKNAGSIKVRIEGHTDNVGKPASNKKLSQARADSVKAYLVKKGVDGARLTSVGFGQEVPVADNATSDGRDQNRRVEFMIEK